MNKIKIYVMESCPDCKLVKSKVGNDERYQIIDIGKDVRDLKEFLSLRDNDKAFDEIKKFNAIGIPCILYSNGKISFDVKELGIEQTEKKTCSLNDKTGC